MAKVTPGYKLYLYQLLSRKLGFGKQTLLPQVEEALSSDDIVPQDLECATVQELAEACKDFLKVTVFKKGRVYVTVIKNDDWEQMLSTPDEKPAKETKKAASGGPKTWKKKKKTGKKALKPVKPGKQRREREAAERQAAAEQAEAEAIALAQAAALAEEAALAEAAAQAEEAARATAAALSQKTSDTKTTPTVGTKDEAQISGSEAEEEVAEAILAEPTQEAQPEPTQAPKKADEPQFAPTPTPDQKAVADSIKEQEDTQDAGPQPKPSVASQDTNPVATNQTPTAPEAPPPISLTITYDPYEDMERELELQRQQEQQSTPLVRDVKPPVGVEPQQSPAKPAIPLADLPQDFGTEVSCKDALLRVLYQLLPFDAEPMAVLDEDWRTARSTGTLSGSRTRVTFPLRYLKEDCTPLTATLRKSTKNAFGKQWALVLVDGDDGTGETHLSVGMEGLPTVDEGAWSDLSASSSAGLAASPVRALTSQVVIGTWDGFLGALANLAAPERWNYPGEGVGKSSRYGILREYVATSFQRIVEQERLAVSNDGSFAAFNTGLLTSLGDEIYACLTHRRGDIPWQFEGFATAGAGELGARLIGTLPQLPEPASYLSSIDDVACNPKRMVILDTEQIFGRQLGRLPKAFLSERLDGRGEASKILAQKAALSADDLTLLSRLIKTDASLYRRLRRALDDAVEQSMLAVRASYRIAVPVYDPANAKVKLLIPLCLVEDGKADCALALDLQPSGAYRAAAILPLERAYACARVISREQPLWLAARNVLQGR